MIGTVGSTRLADEDAIEIAYGLHSDYWGKGYMVEALRMFIKLYWAVESKPLSTLPAPGNFYPQSSLITAAAPLATSARSQLSVPLRNMTPMLTP